MSRITCPNCIKDFMTRRGLQKHLLSVHQQVFIEFSDQTRSLTKVELEVTMQKLRCGQCSKTVNQPESAAGRPKSVLRV